MSRAALTASVSRLSFSLADCFHQLFNVSTYDGRTEGTLMWKEQGRAVVRGRAMLPGFTSTILESRGRRGVHEKKRRLPK